MGILDFDIAVFGVNEAATIAACIASIDRACAGSRAHIAVLLNGTTDESIDRLHALRLSFAAMSVYRFPVADKANAINHYIHGLRRKAAVHVCVDAYTRIGEGSLKAFAEALEAQENVSIVSGLPVTGRSAGAVAAAVMQGGVVTGQLHGMRPGFLDRMVEAGLRLPLQLYRGDGLLGSMAAHDLDPSRHPWDRRRVQGVAAASFAISPLSPFRWHDIRRQFRREIRQARGLMENAAIKAIVYKRGYGALPQNANDMLRAWLKTDGPRPRSLREKFFTRLALDRLEQARNVEPAAAELVFRL